MTGIIASIVEAYGELRVNKSRILLALIGVAFSVFALTATLALGGMLQAASQQVQESWNGRPAVIQIQGGGGGEDLSPAQRDAVILEELDRMGIEQRSRKVESSLGIQTRQGVTSMNVSGVDPAYGTMYRKNVIAGRWIADSDQKRLAPALVMNEAAYDLAGRPALGSDTVTLYNGSEKSEAVVIGVVQGASDDWPSAFTATGSMDELPGIDDSTLTNGMYLAWVPPESADAVSIELGNRLADTPAGSFQAYSNYYEDETLEIMTKAILAVAGVILLLGAMGLINIALVTVRYRVREIGIRRSYGATGGRIFFGVLMESVVATFLAGAIGVTAAIALARAPFIEQFFASVGLVDVPPFPVGAVIIGLGAATLVGIIAGALPALIATRIKVIDAIRS